MIAMPRNVLRSRTQGPIHFGELCYAPQLVGGTHRAYGPQLAEEVPYPEHCRSHLHSGKDIDYLDFLAEVTAVTVPLSDWWGSETTMDAVGTSASSSDSNESGGK